MTKVSHALMLLLFCLAAHTLTAQRTQTGMQKPPQTYENVHVQKLAGDSLSTQFLIWIKKEVKAHHHAAHSETVYILEGKGEMRLGNETFGVKPGDCIFIPQGTVHAVTVTKGPMKVISIQSPHFDGTDRIMD